jgi:hypothetical protein
VFLLPIRGRSLDENREDGGSNLPSMEGVTHRTRSLETVEEEDDDDDDGDDDGGDGGDGGDGWWW